MSKSKWVVTINSPGGEKFSRHVVEGGDGAGLLDLLSRSRAKAEQRYGVPIRAIVIQEAGLDGFWIHRLLLAEGIESHVVDAASIAVNRRHRRAKTDAIDGETLLRTLMAWARGERRVCSMVRAPSPEEEDRRRLTRERGTLLKERIQHTNRVKGLLSGQGIRDYNPCDRESSGEENEHEVLKPFIAIQRVQLPPGKGQPTSRKRALHGGRRRPS